MLSKKKPMKSDIALCRLNRLLDVLEANKVELSESGVDAIVCDDGVVIFSVNEKQTEILMIKNIHRANFSINLTEEEMQDFNGGKGLMARYSRSGAEAGGKGKGGRKAETRT